MVEANGPTSGSTTNEEGEETHVEIDIDEEIKKSCTSDGGSKPIGRLS